MSLVLLSIMSCAFAIGFVVMVYLWQKARAEPAEAKAQLEQLRQSIKMAQENLDARLKEKENACRQSLDEKDSACRSLIAAKDKAYSDALAEKTATCERMIADKESSCKKQLAEKDDAYARAVAEKENILAQILKEKDGSLVKKEETWRQMLADKDVACAKAVEEKELACRKIIEEKESAIKSREVACDQSLLAKDESIKKLIEEKEAAIRSREDACNMALKEKDAACAKVLAEKDAVLRRKDDDVKRMLADRDEQMAKVLREKNAEIERFLQEKERSFAEVVKTLQAQFANLAAQTLKSQSGDLTKKNTEQLESVLKPLREQLEILRSATERTQAEHAKLAESIGKDVGRISDVAKELAGVSEALSSNSGFQGRKGEEILAEKLRQAGLEEGVNFFLQSGTSSDRPDAQVCDTENRWLVIDSKVVLTSYFQYTEAKDEGTRKAKLTEHVARVREKIDQLAKKKYPKVLSDEYKDRNYLPVTAMFVGYEAPLLEALKAEPSLWKFAADNNVILVTPLTLLAYLRLVYLAWQHEKEARNQAEIVNTARELLTRMNSFLVTFEGMGKALLDMQSKYEDARGILVDTPHAQTIAKAAHKLIDLHVKLESRKGKRIEKAACLKELGPDDQTPDAEVMDIDDGTGGVSANAG